MALGLYAAILALGAAAGGDLSSTPPCPPEQLLWNGLCRPAVWPPQRPGGITKAVASPDYLRPSEKPAAINITVGRQLFVDTFLIDTNLSSNSVELRYHSPEYADANPVLRATEPWEVSARANTGYGGFASPFSGGAFYNPELDRYELYYRCGDVSCVAHSPDASPGSWTKPGLHAGRSNPGWRGESSPPPKICAGKPCNVVLDRVYDGATVWLDVDGGNASRRYVLATGGSNYTIYTSADGTTFHPEAISGPIQDRSSVYFDGLRNKWVYSIKASNGMAPPIKSQRMRKYYEGDDVVQDCHWHHDKLVNWASADVDDDKNIACGGEAELYNLDGAAYESVVVGLLSIITGKRCNPPRPFHRGGEQDAVYVGFSRNGFDFLRSPERAAAFLPMSPHPGDWNFQNVQSTGGGFLTMPETLVFFVGARSGSCAGAPGCANAQWNGNATTGMATLRRDGFASATTAASGGTLITAVIVWSAGAHFFVNVNVSAGGPLSIELLSAGGGVLKTAIPVPAGTDSTLHHVLWEGHLGLEKYRGVPVRLRFQLSGGSHLYSFWVSEEVTGCSGGSVAGGGRGYNSSRDLCVGTGGPM